MKKLNSVDFSTKLDGSWVAKHVPSGKVAHGLSRQEAEDAMIDLLTDQDKEHNDNIPLTSPRFQGISKKIALRLEGPISRMLGLHDGYARLEAYEAGMARIRLGGGCQGCPSSLITLSGSVKADLQHQFGSEVVADVLPVME